MSRGEVFRRPAGNRKYDLESCAEQPRNAWTINRQEADQFCRFVRAFKREYPEANIIQTTLAERAFKAAIMLQRLEDRRVFLAGDETGAVKVDKYYLEIEPEEYARWEKEHREWGTFYQRQLLECSKILLANGIQLNIEGDIGTIFRLDQDTKIRVEKYKDGDSHQTQNP